MVLGMLERMITKVSEIQFADEQSITFLSNPIYRKYLPNTKAAGVVLTAKDVAACPDQVVPFVTDNPRLVLARVLHLCYEEPSRVASIDATAVIDPSVRVGAGVHIGPYCVVGADTELADGVRLEAGVVIGARCKLGIGSKLMPRVTLYDWRRVAVSSESVVYSDMAKLRTLRRLLKNGEPHVSSAKVVLVGLS